MPKSPKQEIETKTSTLGLSPAVLAKRDFVKPQWWCPKVNLEFDRWCDTDNPKTVTSKNVIKATSCIREDIPQTPLYRSKCCVQLDMELNYKYEIFHRTGSFHERGALYSLLMLDDIERKAGVITASLGNWAMALAYHGHRLNIPITIIMPDGTSETTVDKCEEFGAVVVLHGKDLSEAKTYAFMLIFEGNKFTYLNGYDHPHVISGAGSIGLEILEQLPKTEAILVPVGGGGLIAGIAAIVKKLKPQVLIYGIEPKNCSCFFKAMENEQPYLTVVSPSVASLGVPEAGCNAFYTARSLIDKMILVEDNWITKAILHLAEEENFITEGAGATALSALFSNINILPELIGKTVVCIVTGGNIDYSILSRSLERAKALQGRLVKFTITLPGENTKERVKVLSIVANVGCNVLETHVEEALLDEDFHKIYFTVVCETRDIAHACRLRRVMNHLFSECNFDEDPFEPVPYCTCYPNKISF